MLSFQKGQNDSFEQLMHKYYSSILNFIYRMIGSEETAEELTQEVFTKIYEHVNKYKPQSTFKTWIYVIAKNLTLNELRRSRNKTKEEIFEGDEIDHKSENRPEEQYEQSELALAVKTAIQTLPENQRIATILRRYEDLAYEDIAKTMNVSEKAVKSLLNRAKESLKIKLSKFVDNN